MIFTEITIQKKKKPVMWVPNGKIISKRKITKYLNNEVNKPVNRIVLRVMSGSEITKTSTGRVDSCSSILVTSFDSLPFQNCTNKLT